MRLSFFLFLFVFSACATNKPVDPAGAKSRPFYADAPVYFDHLAFDPSKIAPPPAPGSKVDNEDLAEIEQFQKTRTAAQCAAAGHEVKPDFQNFFGHMSPFVKPTPDEVDEIFWKLRSDIARTVSKVKKHYNRERPYRRDEKRFVPCIKKEDGKAYPSGHAAIARLFAKVLSELDPANAKKYFSHAEDSAMNRLIGGVHHRSDLVVGKEMADMVYGKIIKTEAYKADLTKLRSHLQK
jgi:acid phosphatase (class A)